MGKTKKKAEPAAVLEEVIFIADGGNYCAFRGGKQVPEEQGNAWLEILQAKLDRGAVGPKTSVEMPGWHSPMKVAHLVAAGHLKAPKERSGR